MAEAKAPEKKKDAGKPKKAAKPAGGGWLSRFTGMFSAAGCASVLAALFLVLLVIGVWLVFYFEPGNVPWRHAMSWTRIAIVTLLVIAIPLALYQAIRFWLEGEQSAFPDIDFAWNAGLEAL